MKKTEENQLFSLTPHFKCVEKLDKQAIAATELLKGSCFNLIDSARISLEILENLQGSVSIERVRRIVRLGIKSLLHEEQSVSFAYAVEYTLQCKQQRSARTIQDIRQTTNKLMQCDKGLAERMIRGISSADWSRILRTAYGHSPSRYTKARANLSGVYTVAFKQGWCDENPIMRIDCPKLNERIIEPLKIDEIQSLVSKAHHQTHRDCLPALGLMLYAGVRPDEVKRLTWQDIDWEEGELHMAARHTKTGGGRHIPLCKPLITLLKQQRGVGFICPKRWKERWQLLRQAAGFKTWVPDVLRHSYASYHAKHYRDLPLLQLAMGHRDCRLLLTRYVNLRGITKKDALNFWTKNLLRV